MRVTEDETHRPVGARTVFVWCVAGALMVIPIAAAVKVLATPMMRARDVPQPPDPPEATDGPDPVDTPAVTSVPAQPARDAGEDSRQ